MWFYAEQFSDGLWFAIYSCTCAMCGHVIIQIRQMHTMLAGVSACLWLCCGKPWKRGRLFRNFGATPILSRGFGSGSRSSSSGWRTRHSHTFTFDEKFSLPDSLSQNGGLVRTIREGPLTSHAGWERQVPLLQIWGMFYMLCGTNKKSWQQDSMKWTTPAMSHSPEMFVQTFRGTSQNVRQSHRTIQNHTEPYRTIQNHTEPYRTIQNHTEPYRTIQNLESMCQVLGTWPQLLDNQNCHPTLCESTACTLEVPAPS